ncbi:MAG: DNA translocase FtsK [Lachnospiraceae bacterium]|nr:DNA translocase FtsK [Lachnospiraceae bacterium]
MIYIFRSNIPVEEWRNRKPLLETAFDCTILKIENGSSKKTVRVTTLPSDFKIPAKLEWSDEYIKKASGVVTLGKSALEEIIFDLNRVPHVLIAGETGSGKSVILRMILWQFINQGSRVYMFDFKGGVEFGLDYERYGEVVIERKRALKILEELEKENAKRLSLFREMRVKNIVEYNRKTKQNLCRIGVFCDEVAEMLDKKGAPKEIKEMMEKIEGKISTLARLSRATGINLILGMQRPDANVLTGQIKNNIPVRISGRFADKTASEIVLGTTDAVNLPDIKGRFLYKVGNVTEEFQAYYFDDETMLKDVFAEVGDMLTDMPEYQEKRGAYGGRKKRAEKDYGEPEATQSEFLVKPIENPYEEMSAEEFEKEREAMDEYDLNLDFFG